jgi:C_GCAxxG_C_C family probable redox protein
MCGAVSGAIMVIGLKYGKTDADDDAATDKTRTLARQFIHEFIAKNGSVNCTDLLGLNLSNPEEFAQARDNKLFVTKCPELVRDATEILEKIL